MDIDNIKNDFSYNNNVAGAAKHIRMGQWQMLVFFLFFYQNPFHFYNFSGFLRKVYSLLSMQLGLTTLIGAVFLFTPGVKEVVQV